MRVLVVVPLLVVVFCLSQACRRQSVPLPTYEVEHASAPLRIDGLLNDFDWLMAQRIYLSKLAHEPEDSRPLRENTAVAALWDEQNLYLAFAIQDREVWATLTTHDARLFPEECVEVFIDPNGDGRRYMEAQINSLGTVRDLLVDGSVKNPSYRQYDEMARWDFEDLQKAITIHHDAAGRDYGWTLEIAIPWRNLGFSGKSWPPHAGDELRINFYRFERARSGTYPLERSGWSPVPGTFHDPARFGRFVFRDGRIGTSSAKTESSRPPGLNCLSMEHLTDPFPRFSMRNMLRTVRDNRGVRPRRYRHVERFTGPMGSRRVVDLE